MKKLLWIECEPLISKNSKIYRADYKGFKFRIIESKGEVCVLIGNFDTKGIIYNPKEDNIEFNSLKDAKNYCEQYCS